MVQYLLLRVTPNCVTQNSYQVTDCELRFDPTVICYDFFASNSVILGAHLIALTHISLTSSRSHLALVRYERVVRVALQTSDLMGSGMHQFQLGGELGFGRPHLVACIG